MWRVFFFNVDDYNGSRLPAAAGEWAVQISAVNAEESMYLSRGENPDAILITTFNKMMVRL